ncbi:DNA-processing protein DprA [Pseudoclavibacter sp. CFCC 13611]|uniref:DNA-processing protein DprA n=1 Tax=Pseudoclavibacter sp. CFCC 13611 TaxID=2615178 RepID=UPI0013010E15|nr:DNA-processing protein DprA [Pseudoclavibacter sp. CFCC 13611]KAB1664405.1 DNA-protecting protein DprA [Pseudoclavibacter sp. CFCC 13611]
MIGNGSLVDIMADVHGLTSSETAAVTAQLHALHESGRAESIEPALAAAWWSSLIEPGDGVAGSLVRQHGVVDALRQVVVDIRAQHDSSRHGAQTSQYREALRRWSPRLGDRRFLDSLSSAASLHATLLIPGDASWPARFADLAEHAPMCLWALGRPTLLTRPRTISIVGARSASSYGLEACAELVQGCVGHGFSVVSGGAYGIDRQAHRAALSLQGDTVAVLAGGIDRLYPAGNEELLREIADRGCLIAEQAPGTPPTRWRFLQRNRVIAALGAMTVVVEAGRRSGAINTVHHAAQLGRHVAAVPGSIFSAMSAGTNHLIRDGLASLVTGADDCLTMLTAQPELEMAQVQTDGLRPELVRVHDALHPRQAQDVLGIAQLSGMPLTTVRSCLNELELLQLACHRGGGAWLRG